MSSGIVFRIQRYSIHDGPGIRTAVFLKGCPLDCWWCHNPEGKDLSPAAVFHEDRCLNCGRCADAKHSGEGHSDPNVGNGRYTGGGSHAGSNAGNGRYAGSNAGNGRYTGGGSHAGSNAGNGRYTGGDSHKDLNRSGGQYPGDGQISYDGQSSRDDQSRRDGLNCRDGSYADLCPSGAQEIIGKEMTVASVMEAIEKDSAFYDESGGGVTFTGGEPFMQYEFLHELLLACREKGIHTAVETSGYTPRNNLMEAAELTGLFLYDLKLMDNEKHIQYTGVSNELITDNLGRLAAVHGNICVRIPIIPGINDDDGNIDATCAFLEGIGLRNVSILPYHSTGSYKYKQLGLDYRLSDIRSPDKKDMQRIADIFINKGFNVNIGGSGR